MKLQELTFTAVLIFCLCTSLALAEVPGTINFQGNLTDSSGAPETGIFSMEFLIYADSTGGSALWNETHSSVEVIDGLFRVYLGSVTTFPDTVFDGSVRWLETEVESETLSPREKLVTVPYGFKSKTTDTAAWADSAGHALWADTATAALWVSDITRVDTADYAVLAESSAWADSAGHAANSDTAGYAASAPPDNDWTVTGDSLYNLNKNIGIGTASPNKRLTLKSNSATNDACILLDAQWNPEIFMDKGGFDADSKIHFQSQGLDNWTFFHDGSEDALKFNHITLGNMLTLSGDSNAVGIGTAFPEEKLDVNGNIRTTGFTMPTGASDGKVLTSNASGVASWANTVGGSGTTGYIPKFATNLTLDNSVIRQSGSNILIGGTQFTHKLTITSSDDNTVRLIGPDGGLGYGARLNFGDDDYVYLDEDADDKLYIYTRLRTCIMGGNVGIGVTDPLNDLDVEGNMAVGATYSGTNYAPTNGMIVEGNVGIGTPSPSYKLHVNGACYASTLNTGLGNYELYAMNQNVRTSDSPTFNRVYLSDYGYALGGFHVGGTSDPGTDNLVVDGAITGATVNTGLGANELYSMNQNVTTSSGVTFATVNTGQGANELYDMNQNVMTSSAVTFATVNTGQGANELYAMNQNVRSSDNVDFNQLSVGTTYSTHKATIANTTADDVLRLMGPDGGGFYYGARLNFGDADYVYLDEDTDDHLLIHGNSGIMLGGSSVSVDNMSGTTSGNLVRWYNDRLYYDSSSRRYKKDIQPLKDNFEKILDVEPKSFIDRASGERNIGFIAEELEEVGLDNLVIERDGRPDAIKYQLISVYLLEMIKEVKKENQELRVAIEELKNTIK